MGIALKTRKVTQPQKVHLFKMDVAVVGIKFPSMYIRRMSIRPHTPNLGTQLSKTHQLKPCQFAPSESDPFISNYETNVFQLS